MAELAFRIVGSDSAQREVPVEAGLTLGRSGDNSCKIEDPKASGKHAVVVEDGGALYIEDAGSANHTLIHNGPVLKKGERHALAPGCAFQIGDTRIVVVVKSDASSGGGEAAKTIAAHVQFGDHEGESETAQPGGDERVDNLAELAAFKTARPRIVICNEAIRRIDEVNKVSWMVGRSAESADCVIDHPAVSGSHARIIFSKRKFFLEDMGSRNGTYVGKEKAAPNSRIQLAPETYIRLGSIEVLFVADCDATGHKTDPQRIRGALELLVRDGKISRLQREEAEREAASADRHAGEILLKKGYIKVEQWTDALRRGELIDLNPAMEKAAGGGGGVKGLLIVVIALLVVLVVILLAKPEILESLGLKGGD